jgi:Ca-activated chloride channel family protein
VTGLTPDELSKEPLGVDEQSLPTSPPFTDDVRTEAEQLDLYAALHSALRVGSSEAFDGMAQRVLLFTSGLPSGGATSKANLIDVGRTLGQLDIGVSVFGVGEYFERSLVEALAEASSGNYSVSTSSADLILAVESEAASGFVPIGRNLEIEVTPAPGYSIGDIYGARLVERVGDRVILKSPVLFLGARQGSQDTDMGRRGGGGGWFVQLVADTQPGEAAAEAAPAMDVRISYDDAFSGETVVQEFTLETPLGVGNNPEPEDPYFSGEFSPKIFMMLNMYLALNGALSYFEQGSCEYALGMQAMMDLSYFLWQQNFDDPDIADDYQLLIDLTDAFRSQCTSDVVLWPVAGETSCFYS